eukprot:1161350-Pelagomonas_calceolata.AAC.16
MGPILGKEKALSLYSFVKEPLRGMAPCSVSSTSSSHMWCKQGCCMDAASGAADGAQGEAARANAPAVRPARRLRMG